MERVRLHQLIDGVDREIEVKASAVPIKERSGWKVVAPRKPRPKPAPVSPEPSGSGVAASPEAASHNTAEEI